MCFPCQQSTSFVGHEIIDIRCSVIWTTELHGAILRVREDSELTRGRECNAIVKEILLSMFIQILNYIQSIRDCNYYMSSFFRIENRVLCVREMRRSRLFCISVRARIGSLCIWRPCTRTVPKYTSIRLRYVHVTVPPTYIRGPPFASVIHSIPSLLRLSTPSLLSLSPAVF